MSVVEPRLKARLDARRSKGGSDSPKLLRPKIRLVFVVEGGGGGFSSCEAVGARDWRIE